jgi:hypothetical protein
VSDALVQNYEKHLAETIQKAADGLSLRTIKGNKVGNVLVAEIKGNDRQCMPQRGNLSCET